ncbi:ATP-binding protein [Streptosporangiaceae bacterium NEAU-GS5]|nr:ATP-binding protein [Streptosporangiaceae bacterium NEAU-GS5]
MPTWRDEIPTSGSVELPPDPRALDGLGRNHSLETAVADLVDNSIDAGASNVLIRFVRVEGRLRALYVVDNGHGIPESKIDSAMTVGGRRQYGSSDLGKFGLGLKAASFSQARSLTVLSKAFGSRAVGRRWLLKPDRRGFHCDVVSTEFADDEFERRWGIAEMDTGTVVRWDDVTGFPATSDDGRVERFISSAASALRTHLGLVFHRIIEAARVTIEIDVEDVDIDSPGPRIPVEAINPFGYARSGNAAYPKNLTARVGDLEIRFACHIWSGRSSLPQFRLPGGAESRQGIYFYRRGRLLQAGGGWHGMRPMDRRLQLARVAVEIDDDVLRLFTMNPEKSKVNVGPEFTQLAEHSKAEDGTTFHDYLEAAEETYTDSRKRSHERRKMAPLGKGIAPELRRAIEREVPFDEDLEPIDIRWKPFPNEDFFAIDREARALWLNERYRPEARVARRSVNDAPLLKALLYLVAENLFHGEYLGARDRDNIALYQEILTAAAKSDQP